MFLQDGTPAMLEPTKKTNIYIYISIYIYIYWVLPCHQDCRMLPRSIASHNSLQTSTPKLMTAFGHQFQKKRRNQAAAYGDNRHIASKPCRHHPAQNTLHICQHEVWKANTVLVLRALWDTCSAFYTPETQSRAYMFQTSGRVGVNLFHRM